MNARRLATLPADVRVIVPDKSDDLVADLATLWFMEQLGGWLSSPRSQRSSSR